MAVVNRTARDLGDIVNQVNRRLDNLERRGRGFVIPEVVGGTTYASDEPPGGVIADGSLWIDTNDGNRIYRYDASTSTWVPTLDPTIDITRNQAAVQIAATMDSAGLSDGSAMLFYDNTAPTASGVGDLWVDTDDSELYKWSGLAWVDQNDPALGGILSHQAMETTVADGQVKVWSQFSEPTALGFGDLWIKTSDDPPTLWRWNNYDWVQVVDWDTWLAQQAVAVKITSFYQDDPPTSTAIGDLWFDTNDGNKAYRAASVGADAITAGEWVAVQDEAIAEAQETADSKIKTFYVATEPATGMSTGDLWYDTDNDNLVSRYNGSAWVPLPAGNAAIADGSVTAIKLDLSPGDLDDIVDIGPDGNAPATAPTLTWIGGIGSVFFRWNPVSNADPTEYALYVRAGSAPTTTDDTYLVAAGNILQGVVREAIGPDPEDAGGPEIESPVTTGVDYYGIVLAYDDDGKGPNSATAVAQSVAINSPDIATDAIATRHLQADSVGVDQLQAGSIDADKLAARLILASELLLGELDISGVDPATMNPNLLPAMTSANILSGGTFDEGFWRRTVTTDWTFVPETYSPPNDDAYWTRMAPGSLEALRVVRTPGTSGTFELRTVVTVQPLTEYRFELNSSAPGANPAMASSGLDNPNVNSVKWYASSDSSIQDAETISWKSFPKETTPRPDLTQFDRGIIRTGTGQTQLYLVVRITSNFMVAAGEGHLIVFPELRQIAGSTTVPAVPVNPASVTATDATADPTATAWKASAVWSGTTSSIVRSSALVTVSSSGGAFGPSRFSTPGRYAIPGESQTFQQARGVRITTQSAGTTLGLRARIMTPGLAVPALSPMESLLLDVGFGGLTQAVDGLDDFTLTASWFNGSNALISNQAIIDLDAAGLVAQGVTNLTENHFTLQLSPPSGAASVVIWSEFTNGPSGNLVASTNYLPTMHGLRLYTLDAINYNYGNMAKRHVKIDSSGVYLINAQGQVQISIPTDESETPTFKGGIEAEWARFLAGASFEGASEVSKDATVTLSDGTKSPVGVPTLTQEYEQYTLQRQPPDGQFPGFSTKPTLNPAQVTGMCWKSEWNEMWLMENRGGGSALWRFSASGACKWAGLQDGWQNAVPYEDTRTTPGVNDSLYAGEFSGTHWAQVYTGSVKLFNKFPAGAIPVDVEPVYSWNQSNNKLYVHYPHTDGSGRHVYKRFGVNTTSGGDLTLEETVVSGSGTSRSSSGAGLAGAVIDGSSIYTAARDTTAADVYAFATGSGGALNAGARWQLASPPRGFCHDGSNFWQVDTAGKFTKYSTWTWTETNHKLYAGITWFDSDTGGTGIHETNLTSLASTTLKKRISSVRLTLPSVPDKGGADDPNKWRLYAFKGASIALPGGRTSLFLQSEGGSATQQTTYIIPANGLVVSGTNPPAANNFPGAGAGRVISSAVDGSSNPLIDLRGDGTYTLGQLSTKTGRMATWVMTGGTAVAQNTYVPDPGGYTGIVGDYTVNDGWCGVTYSSGGVFTCTEKGLYQFEVGFNFTAAANTRRWTLAWINESTFDDTTCYRMHAEASLNGNHQAILRFDIKLNSGDTVRAGWRQDSAGSLTATTAQGFKISGTMYSRYMQVLRKA